MPTYRVVRSVTFIHGGDGAQGGISVEYVEPAKDVFKTGLMVNHAIFIPAGSDYDDEIDAVLDAVLEALDDALDDVARGERAEIPDEEEATDDDDDED